MQAHSVSTPGRTKKIIAAIWVAAISLSSVPASYFNGVSDSWIDAIVHFFILHSQLEQVKLDALNLKSMAYKM